MPNYDFNCAEHGLFEAQSRFDEAAQSVTPVPCWCGRTSTHVWVQSPGFNIDMRVDQVIGDRFYEKRSQIQTHLVEERLERRTQTPAPWHSEEFGERFMDRFNKNVARHNAGELPRPEAPKAEDVAEIATAAEKLIHNSGKFK